MTFMLILGIPLAFIVASIVLIRWGKSKRREAEPGEVRGDIGKSLLTGSIVAFAVFALQLRLYSEHRTDEKEDQFYFSVTFAENLNNLEPDYPLAHMYLSGKSLNGAELQNQDLVGANLQDASLRGANLEGADLEDANLFGADMTEAHLIGATFKNADLRETDFNEAEMAIQPGRTDFGGAKVNAKTCWPMDVAANIHLLSESRDALVRRPVKVHGQTLVEAESDRSWGRACVVDDENLVEDLELYAHGHIRATIAGDELRQTAHRLAVTFGRDTANILARFEHGRPMSEFGPTAPALQPLVCAGARRLTMRAADFGNHQFGVLVVRRPDQPPGNTVLIRHPVDLAFPKYTILFEKPLPQGSTLTLVAERPEGRNFARFVSRRRIRRC